MSMQGGKTASKDDDEDVAMEERLMQKMTEMKIFWSIDKNPRICGSSIST